jgi:hypothetical protein
MGMSVCPAHAHEEVGMPPNVNNTDDRVFVAIT